MEKKEINRVLRLNKNDLNIHTAQILLDDYKLYLSTSIIEFKKIKLLKDLNLTNDDSNWKSIYDREYINIRDYKKIIKIITNRLNDYKAIAVKDKSSEYWKKIKKDIIKEADKEMKNKYNDNNIKSPFITPGKN